MLVPEVDAVGPPVTVTVLFKANDCTVGITSQLPLVSGVKIYPSDSKPLNIFVLFGANTLIIILSVTSLQLFPIAVKSSTVYGVPAVPTMTGT